MKQSELVSLCMELLIDVGIALENQALVQALKDRNIEEVKRILMEEF